MAVTVVFDVESVPDGNLLAETKYAGMRLSAEAAISMAAHDAKRDSDGKSDFIPMMYHKPVALVALITKGDLAVAESIVLTGEPQKIASSFWKIMETEPMVVTFNGRMFDLPLLELTAFKHGIAIPKCYFGKYGHRNRFSDLHLDLQDWFNNFGACRVGGLDVLAKMLNRPGKIMDDGVKVDGSLVLSMYNKGNIDKIVDYCHRDVIDTYAVFLRQRVMVGEITLAKEKSLMALTAEALGDRVWNPAG